MRHYIAYHNPETMKFDAQDISGFSVVTGKNVTRVLGNRVWVITGRGAPRQVEQYYQGRSEEFKGKKLQEVEPNIRKRLTEEREALKTKEYLARLREHAEIEINLTGRAEPESTSPGQSSPTPPAH